MEALVGNKFLDKSGKAYTLKDIIKPDTKAVGLYFSAHWCPPCRGFTPQLAQWYVKDLKSKGLEIIFISSDKGQKEFDEYLGEQPWYALPFEDRDRKNKLSSKFKVQGIPSFVIVSPTTGELITDGGRKAVSMDPTGQSLPWTPKTPKDILNTAKYLTKTGSTTTFEALQSSNDVIGLYFSGSWCGPCHAFTPKLSETYHKLKQEGKKFEVVFVSSDKDEGSFKKYYDSMPWVALEFSSNAKDELSDTYKVEGIPSLVLLDAKTLKTINADTVGAVMQDPEGKKYPWEPQACEILSRATAGKIAGDPVVFIFCASDEEAEARQADFSAAVEAWQGTKEGGAVCKGDVCIPVGDKLEGSEDVTFYVCGTSDPVVARVKELTQAGENPVAILELQKKQFSKSKIIGEVTPKAVRGFLAEYLAGKADTGVVQG